MRWIVGAFVLVAVLAAQAAPQVPANDTLTYEPVAPSVRTLIEQAGNADRDVARLRYLRTLEASNEVGPRLREDLTVLLSEVEQYVSANRGEGHIGTVLGGYDPDAPFGKRLPQESPLKAIEDIYGARAEIWIPIQSGSVWNDVPRRRRLFRSALARLQRAHRAFPENDVVAMYLGHPTPWPRSYEHLPQAPEWANLQREAIGGLQDIIHWWITHRQRADGSFGGGWGDDCEMWRWWAPVLLAFQDTTVISAQEEFAGGMFAREQMRKGYLDYLTDVEHASEDFTDTVVPMLLLRPDDPEWMRRAKSLHGFMTNTWMGRNQRGFLQFKSTYISADSADTSDPQLTTDTPYHARVAQPAFVAWLRTRDPALERLLSNWMDTWVDATARAGCGKPAGVVPAGIHWPDGRPCGVGEHWWLPMNHPPEPSLYRWPSALTYVLDGLLVTHHITGEEKYLAPVRSTADMFLEYRSMENPKTGSKAWTAEQLGPEDPAAGAIGTQLQNVLAKYRSITGDHRYDSLLTAGDGYGGFRISGDKEGLTAALRSSARAVRHNWEAYTSEVRWTDRVLNLPRQWMARYAPEFAHVPDTDLLFNMVTGNTGQPHLFPTSAVRWLTNPRDLAVLVTGAETRKFAAELFHFGTEARRVTAEVYLLESGRYRMTLEAVGDGSEEQLVDRAIDISGARSRIQFELPARRLCRLTLTRASDED